MGHLNTKYCHTAFYRVKKILICSWKIVWMSDNRGRFPTRFDGYCNPEQSRSVFNMLDLQLTCC